MNEQEYQVRRTDGHEIPPEACFLVLRLDDSAEARLAAQSYANFLGLGEAANVIRECVEHLTTPPVCICDIRAEPEEGCEPQLCPLHDRETKVWRHGEFEDELRMVRARCTGCGQVFTKEVGDETTVCHLPKCKNKP